MQYIRQVEIKIGKMSKCHGVLSRIRSPNNESWDMWAMSVPHGDRHVFPLQLLPGGRAVEQKNSRMFLSWESGNSQVCKNEVKRN